jgi:excisionase family DNA binding protein
MDQLLLRPEQAAALLGISRTRCYELMADGTLPVYRLGGRGGGRIPYRALRDMIDAGTTGLRAETDEEGEIRLVKR